MKKFLSLNQEQFAVIFRTLLQCTGAILGTLGIVNEDVWLTISGPIFSLAITAWGMRARSDTNLVKSAAAVSGVETIVVASNTPASAVADDPTYTNVIK